MPLNDIRYGCFRVSILSHNKNKSFSRTRRLNIYIQPHPHFDLFFLSSTTSYCLLNSHVWQHVMWSTQRIRNKFSCLFVRINWMLSVRAGRFIEWSDCSLVGFFTVRNKRLHKSDQKWNINSKLQLKCTVDNNKSLKSCYTSIKNWFLLQTFIVFNFINHVSRRINCIVESSSVYYISYSGFFVSHIHRWSGRLTISTHPYEYNKI